MDRLDYMEQQERSLKAMSRLRMSEKERIRPNSKPSSKGVKSSYAQPKGMRQAHWL